MSRAGLLAVAALLLACAALARAEVVPTASEWREIKRVIAAQREALIAGDGERAFGFAAPSIRSHFGNAAAFMRMVEDGYRALIDARQVEFLEGAVIAGDVVQPLRLVLPDGTVLVAIYGMQRQADRQWRISACVIAPSTLRSAKGSDSTFDSRADHAHASLGMR